jgi:hypothetical protein
MSLVKYSVISNNTKSIPYPSDLLFIEPIRYLKYIKTIDNRESAYLNCPAFTDFFKNVFVIQSPIDIAIDFNKEQDNVTITGEKGVDQDFFNTYVQTRGEQIGKFDKFLMTCTFLQLIFYSKEPVIIEYMPSFTLYKKNINYNLIPGQFRIDKWIRPLDFTFEFIDQSKPIIIKRGDPLFTLRFNSLTNDKIELERELCIDSELFKHTIDNHTTLKRFIPKLSLKAAYNIAEPFINLFWKHKDRK